MDVAVFSSTAYDRDYLLLANQAAGAPHNLVFFEARLSSETAFLADKFPAICGFVNDDLGTETLKLLAESGTRLVTLRSTGFNNVDVAAAAQLGIKVTRVKYYSPYSVAEHAVGLILTLNRKLYRAYNRVRDDNFSLEGLLGFDLHQKTVGVIGTGKIGRIFSQIMAGFGCQIWGYDPFIKDDFLAIANSRYTDLDELYAHADIISLHCPATPENYHLISDDAIAKMKPQVMLINTSRGGLIDTAAAIKGLKSKKIGYLGIDVYEKEADLFFRDLSSEVIQDDQFQLLQSYPNVVITAHQAFFTENALNDITRTTIANLTEFEQGQSLSNEVTSR